MCFIAFPSLFPKTKGVNVQKKIPNLSILSVFGGSYPSRSSIRKSSLKYGAVGRSFISFFMDRQQSVGRSFCVDILFIVNNIRSNLTVRERWSSVQVHCPIRREMEKASNLRFEACPVLVFTSKGDMAMVTCTP